MSQIRKQLGTFREALEFVKAMYSQTHSESLVAKTLASGPSGGTGKGPSPMDVGSVDTGVGDGQEGAEPGQGEGGEGDDEGDVLDLGVVVWKCPCEYN